MRSRFSFFSFLKILAQEIFWDGKEDPRVIPGKRVTHRNPKPKDILGMKGESIAANWYQKKGYQILERNLRLPSCEIDLIARKKGKLVFAEVKTRRDEGYADPFTEVPPARRNRMKRAKGEYLRWKRLPSGTQCRFDIMMILLKDSDPKIKLVEDAF